MADESSVKEDLERLSVSFNELSTAFIRFSLAFNAMSTSVNELVKQNPELFTNQEKDS